MYKQRKQKMVTKADLYSKCVKHNTTYFPLQGETVCFWSPCRCLHAFSHCVPWEFAGYKFRDMLVLLSEIQ